MLSEGLDVKLTDVKLVRGNKASFKDDFSKLKEIIEKIIHNVAGNGNVPKDVLHFMSFLGKPMDSVLWKMLYNHPCTWSAYDVIKNVSLFRMVIECSTIVSKEVTYAMNYMPGEICMNWTSMVPKKASMETFKNDWIKNYSDEEGPLEILYFMRDAYAHFHKTLEPKIQNLTETEGQLFALFPNYLAVFVWLTRRIDALAEIYTKSTFDFIDAKDKIYTPLGRNGTSLGRKSISKSSKMCSDQSSYLTSIRGNVSPQNLNVTSYLREMILQRYKLA